LFIGIKYPVVLIYSIIHDAHSLFFDFYLNNLYDIKVRCIPYIKKKTERKEV